jgi:hypothetical protein
VIEKQEYLELVGLAFSEKSAKPVPTFHTKFSHDQTTKWIHDLCPRLTKWLMTEVQLQAAGAADDVAPYVGPLFHPAFKDNRNFCCWPPNKPIDGTDLNMLLPSGRRHLGKLVFGKF